jgi:hexosaminidase
MLLHTICEKESFSLRKRIFTWYGLLLTGLAITFSLFVLLHLSGANSVLINGKPEVIPSLREWQGSTGTFTLTTTSRIDIDPAYASSLQDTAHVFRSDLFSVNGHLLPIINTDTIQPGDFFLTLNADDASIGDEGYLFESGDAVTIRANTTQGVFYGTRTALQILLQDPARSHIVKGVAHDYPQYKERGFLLDAGRKFFSLTELENYVKLLSWYKMNDFQLHLNDNEIGGGVGPDWMHNYAAFRLNSARFKGLAARDGSYTWQDMRELQDVARQYAVTITPEIDTPAHALALTQYRPALANKQNKEFLDLSNPQTYTFMNEIWNEFLPWFDTRQVAIGADEYLQSDADRYRQYINTYDTYMKQKGRSVRIWGSLSVMKSSIQVHTDVTVDVWDNTWANPVEMVKQGFSIINSNDNLLYIVPKAGYYHDYLDTRLLYEKWEPYIFDLANPRLNLQADDHHVLGAMFAEWNDKLGNVVSDADVYARVKPAAQTISEKLWSTDQDLTYDQFEQLAAQIGAAPGIYLS